VVEKQCLCDNQLVEQAKFCSRCGRPTIASEAVSALPERQPPETASEPSEEATRAPQRTSVLKTLKLGLKTKMVVNMHSRPE